MTKVVTIFGNVTDKCNIGQPNLPPLPVSRGLPIQSATFATWQRQITKVLPTTLPRRHVVQQLRADLIILLLSNVAMHRCRCSISRICPPADRPRMPKHRSRDPSRYSRIQTTDLVASSNYVGASDADCRRSEFTHLC